VLPITLGRPLANGVSSTTVAAANHESGTDAAASYTRKLWMGLKMKAAYLPGC